MEEEEEEEGQTKINKTGVRGVVCWDWEGYMMRRGALRVGSNSDGMGMIINPSMRKTTI